MFNALLVHIVQEKQPTLVTLRCHNHVRVVITLRQAPQLAMLVQLVIIVTKTVSSNLVLVVQFAVGQIHPLPLSQDNVVQVITATLIMSSHVQEELGRPLEQVYALQSFLDRCLSQKIINRSRVPGELTNQTMQPKTHAQSVQ